MQELDRAVTVKGGVAELSAQDIIDELVQALQWCTGSADFAVEGKARIGWIKGPAIALQLAKEWEDMQGCAMEAPSECDPDEGCGTRGGASGYPK